MKIAVTGANGFIGSALVKHFASKGYSVSGLVRKQSNLDNLKNVPVTLHYGDIRDASSLIGFMDGADIVIHTAGAVTDWGSLEYFEEHNVKGTRIVAEQAFKASVKRFVYLGTVAIYGFDVVDADEESSTPHSSMQYSQTKLKASNWLVTFCKNRDMELVIVNPGNVFGPGDHSFIRPYLNLVRKGAFVFINKGEAKTCPTYIGNLVYGIELATVTPGISGEAFIITDGLDIDWKTFTNTFAVELGLNKIRTSVSYNFIYLIAGMMEDAYGLFKIKTAPLLTRYRVNNAGRNYHFSISKAQRMLGYKPVVEFGTAVRETVEWYGKV
ncbi:MAG: NAD-dependent epimerase/dehydratase family protein [Saprospiraceae bacterium]|nr:NAD-dependent epimerase/dehydratase family protein [Saprospiraceae bacterium]